MIARAWIDDEIANHRREMWAEMTALDIAPEPDADNEIDERRCECNPYGSALCDDCRVLEWDARCSA